MNGLVSAIRSDLGYSIVPRCVIRGSFTEKNSEQVNKFLVWPSQYHYDAKFYSW